MPILIIIFLAVLTRKTTHALEPSKKPLAHDEKPSPSKWFPWTGNGSSSIPKDGVYTVNEIAFSEHAVYFKVTSNRDELLLYPRLGSQIYAMAGMQTRLHLIITNPELLMASPPAIAAGFSGMKFKAIAAKTARNSLMGRKSEAVSDTMNDMAAFERGSCLCQAYNKVEYFSSVKPDLFKDVISKFMDHGKTWT